VRTDQAGFQLSREARTGTFQEREVQRTQGAGQVSNSRINDDGSSQSGKERNHFFLSLGGQQFEDISALAGLDDPADGRSFALLDFDRDGWQDLAVVNANAPLLRLYHNRIARRLPAESRGHWLVVKLVGGNTQAAASEQWSNRDGYGAKVWARTGAQTLLREHLCGQGLAAQNSRLLHFGLGSSEHADLEVLWPSGRRQSLPQVAAGSKVTFFEDSERSKDGSTAVIEPYEVRDG
jgi:hypothetical protein